MQVKIYKRPPTLITKPAGHPSRELARRFSRHSEIFAAGDAANIGRYGKRCTGERRDNRDRERKNDQPVSHCDALPL
jgi:hypothetical protein